MLVYVYILKHTFQSLLEISFELRIYRCLDSHVKHNGHMQMSLCSDAEMEDESDTTSVQHYLKVTATYKYIHIYPN